MIVDWANSVTLQDAAAATGDGVVLAVGNRGAVGIGVSGTFVGTLTWESSYDGTNYFGILVLNYTTQVSALTATAPGIFYVAQPGIQFFRARISAYTSGSITVKAEAVPVTSGPEITNVTLSGDIEIGAVEIKNATDDTRAVVKTDGTNNALVVTQNAQPLPTLAATSTIQATQQTSLDAINAVAGTTAGAAVVTDANGTLQQYLRGIVKLLITSGTIILGAGTNAIGKLAANAGVNIGATEDAGPTWTVTRTVTQSSDMSTATAISPTPTSSQKLIGDDFIISTDTAMSFTIQEETSEDIHAVIYLPDNGTAVITTRDGLKTNAINKKFFGKASTAGNVSITACTHSVA